MPQMPVFAAGSSSDYVNGWGDYRWNEFYDQVRDACFTKKLTALRRVTSSETSDTDQFSSRPTKMASTGSAGFEILPNFHVV
jgi:hypothetical protein